MAVRHFQGLDPSQISLREIAKFLDCQNPLIIEAGAFDGTDTRSFLDFWPLANVHSFEPEPELFNGLVKRFMNDSRVKLYNLALSPNADVKTITLKTFQGTPHASSSILSPSLHLSIHPDLNFEREISCDAITVDQWHKAEGISKLDLMWLDLQGAELDILNEATETLSKTNVIHIEVNRVALYEGSATRDDILHFLTNMGFKLEIERIPVISGNALYVRK
jgi:FkbM family methyltransferase